MSDAPRPDPAELLQEIELSSRRVAELATEVSQRIVAFEEWINKLPGKTEATYWFSLDDENEPSSGFGLKLTRESKRWCTLCAYGDLSVDGPEEWAPLTQASVETKILAMENFSGLLQAIVKANNKREAKLKRATRAFDRFAASIGITTEKEGK